MPSDRFGKRYIQRSSGISGSAFDSLIRLQDYIDEDLHRGDGTIWDKIMGAHGALAHAAGSIKSVGGNSIDASPHARYWRDRPPTHAGGGGTTTPDSALPSFTVAQFNILAKGLSSGPPEFFPTPFANESETAETSSKRPVQYFGGFTSLAKPEVVLDYGRIRKWALLNVILGGDINRGENAGSTNEDLDPLFDIIALEEVDEFNSFFGPALLVDATIEKDLIQSSSSQRGFPNCYWGAFQPKPLSPCIKSGWYSDGVALLWKTSRFGTLPHPCNNSEPWVEKGTFHGVANGSSEAKSRNQVYIIVPLRITGSEKCVVVAATHLKAKKGQANEELRHAQALEIRRRCEQIAEKLRHDGCNDTSILILGDFNSEPTDSALSGIISDVKCDQNEWNFQSAYPLGSEGLTHGHNVYTTWKTRKDGTSRRVIDYILHAKKGTSREEENAGMRCTHVLSVPDDDDVEQGGFPGFRYPSDHLLIAAKFSY